MSKACIPNAKQLLDPLKTSNPDRYEMIMKRYEELEDPIYYSAPAVIFVPMACIAQADIQVDDFKYAGFKIPAQGHHHCGIIQRALGWLPGKPDPSEFGTKRQIG